MYFHTVLSSIKCPVCVSKANFLIWKQLLYTYTAFGTRTANYKTKIIRKNTEFLCSSLVKEKFAWARKTNEHLGVEASRMGIQAVKRHAHYNNTQQQCISSTLSWLPSFLFFSKACRILVTSALYPPGHRMTPSLFI